MRILIVEDEPRMLELLRKGLYEHGFTLMTAADCATGLEIAMAHEFDAIVLDIGLRTLDGYVLTQALRERARSAPVLILTARDAEDDIIHGLDMGADDYLTKPFSFLELVARLQSIILTPIRINLRFSQVAERWKSAMNQAMLDFGAEITVDDSRERSTACEPVPAPPIGAKLAPVSSYA
jgi:DNA-binding response OmpR family regulator